MDLTQKLDAAIAKMTETRVVAVGDVMLDTFIYGDVDRISPEGPVPVLNVARETRMLGGAGNVLANLAGLNVKPALVALIGEDAAGQTVREIAASRHADPDGLIADPTRPTILKTRYVARAQQLLRVDAEKNHPVSGSTEQEVIRRAGQALQGAQAVILSDYGKGCLTAAVIGGVIEAAQKNSLPVLVDPKGRDFSKYQGADILTPNRKELAEATGMATATDAEVVAAARSLIDQYGFAGVVVTRSEQGMSVIEKGAAEPVHIRSSVREVYDVSGAGDTVIATLAAGLGAGLTLTEAAVLANKAGGIVVGKIGTASIQANELTTQENALLQKTEGHIAPVTDEWDSAAEQIQKWQAQGIRVGFTNGCFDILHYGHVNYLNQARQRCDKLVLALNSDASVRILKGPERPVNDQIARGTVMAALGSIDMVVFFGAEKEGEDNTPCALIEQVKPDIFFKGGDYTIDQLPEAKIVQAYGGIVDIMPLYEGYSTTSTIEKMKKEKAA